MKSLSDKIRNAATKDMLQFRFNHSENKLFIAEGICFNIRYYAMLEAKNEVIKNRNTKR